MFEETLKSWQQAASDFIKVAESVPYDLRQISGVCGEWSCQQIVAHLAGWQREALKRYGDFQRGQAPTIQYDADTFNTSSIEALKLFSWYEVLDTFRFTTEDLAKTAKALTPDQIAANTGYEEWLAGLSKDLNEHMTEIREWLERNNNL